MSISKSDLERMIRDGNIGKIPVDRPVYFFPELIYPKGGLSSDRACHALWFYYMNVQKLIEGGKMGDNFVIYEGDPKPAWNLRQLFESIAMTYEIRPDVMGRFWGNVDTTCDMCEIPRLPNKESFRFNKTSIILIN